MKSRIMLGAIGALTLSGTAAADLVDIGEFRNSGWGNVDYTGPYGEYVESFRRGDDIHYTVIRVDLQGLLDSIGAQGFISVSVMDTGDNIYGNAPGADIDFFRLVGLDDDIETTFSYDGPVEWHQNETSAELWTRVHALDWGTNGSGLRSYTFASLGMEGVLTQTLSRGQEVLPGGGDSDPLAIKLSEVGNSEGFRVFVETTSIPAPSAMALLGMAALGRSRRRRAA